MGHGAGALNVGPTRFTLVARDERTNAGGLLPAGMTDAKDLKARLTPLQWHVTQEGGTEYAGSSPYEHNDEAGVYHCVCCHAPLFRSDEKYHSGSGWPSYWAPIEGAVRTQEDRSHGMVRTEVRCASCDAHLGHVFPDGPEPTGKRYCINGCALDFRPTETVQARKNRNAT